MTEKRRRKRINMILSVLLALVLAASCGKAKPSGSAGVQDQAPAAAAAPLADGTMEAVFFDVGKGDCILFHCEDRFLLLDTGYAETADQVLEELKDRGVEKLDAAIITHYDKDHVGGAARILSQVPADTIYLPDYEGEADKSGPLLALIQSEGLHAVNVESAQNLALGGLEIRINPALVPYDPLEENDNDASLTVEAFYGEDSWFLPGDIERDAIDVWLEESSREYDLLKLPHHGKKEKNSADMIEAVSPKIAVITDSLDEDASPKVLKKLEEEDVDVYRTSEDGTITVTGNGKKDYEVSVTLR